VLKTIEEEERGPVWQHTPQSLPSPSRQKPVTIVRPALTLLQKPQVPGLDLQRPIPVLQPNLVVPFAMNASGSASSLQTSSEPDEDREIKRLYKENKRIRKNLRDLNEQLSKEILRQRVRGPIAANPKYGYNPNEVEHQILTNDIAFV
jgi:hypothetical protein